MLSAALSPNAFNGYVNSIKISPTEEVSFFWYFRKLDDSRSMLLFLDTKPGGFNRSDYGDETDATHLLEDLIILIIIQVF
jgi:hypothetical protein